MKALLQGIVTPHWKEKSAHPYQSLKIHPIQVTKVAMSSLIHLKVWIDRFYYNKDSRKQTIIEPKRCKKIHTFSYIRMNIRRYPHLTWICPTKCKKIIIQPHTSHFLLPYIMNRLARAGRSRDRIPVGGGGEIFLTRPDRLWGPPSLLYNRYRVFPGGKAAGAWYWPPTPCQRRGRAWVGIHLYTPTLWAVGGLL
jgi:hypothetical protein